jgi:hypothetical protein
MRSVRLSATSLMTTPRTLRTRAAEPRAPGVVAMVPSEGTLHSPEPLWMALTVAAPTALAQEEE